MALSAGQLVLNRYVIESQIGVGGMGEVYRARHRALDMPVAIKVLAGELSENLVQRFAREAMLLARVRHPNVVSILDVGQTDDGAPCMAMEFLEGEALDARLERCKALPWQEGRAIGLSVLMGLDAVHAAGIVHRDLKPANIFVTNSDPEVIKLVDFGIAHSTAKDAAKYTQAGLVIGTPAYMSPEQLIGGQLDARSDLYSLGLVLYELIAGRLPFGAESKGALRRLKDAVPKPGAPQGQPAIPEGVSDAILSALATEPDQRPTDARALYALLRGGKRTEAAPATPATPTKAAAPSPAPEPPAAQSTTGVRALVAAKVPVSRMSRDEQRALAQFALPGRAYHMGGGMWFAVVPAADVTEARAHARRMRDALVERYGQTCKVVWAPASTEFALTPANLSGSAPLPEEISRLLERLL